MKDRHAWWSGVERGFLTAGHVACYLGDDYTIVFWLTPVTSGNSSPV